MFNIIYYLIYSDYVTEKSMLSLNLYRISKAVIEGNQIIGIQYVP